MAQDLASRPPLTSPGGCPTAWLGTVDDVGAAEIVPVDADLPGSGWLAIDDGFAGDAGDEGPGALLDCVGPEFPDEAVVDTAVSPHFVHPPGRLVHGLGVEFDSDEAAGRAETILSARAFAECLARAVAADLGASLLAADVVTTRLGHRVRFTGGDEHGVLPVNLDVTPVRRGRDVGVLWCGDTPDPFPDADLDHLVGRLLGRGG